MYAKTLRAVALPVLAAALIAGCGSSTKTVTIPGSAGATGTSPSSTSGMNVAAGTSTGSGSSNVSKINGIPKPVPAKVLATATWQGMKIQAQMMTPTTFVQPASTNGGSIHWETVKPPKNASFHLMVMLNDAHTNVPIPYATVWATIKKGSKTVYDERQWPMLSAYMGPHYGNNVSLPGPGRYTLTLLISPPEAARHLEYKNVWLKPHRVTEHFSWNGSS